MIHTFQAVADVMMMFKTRCRNEKSQMFEVWPVQRGMPRIAALLSPFEQLFALLLIELTPEIARCGHGMGLPPGPRKRGTPNFLTILLFGFDSSKRLRHEFASEFSGVWRAGN